MNVEVSDLDSHGGFWVTVQGTAGERADRAGVKAAAAARTHAKANGFGKAKRVTTGTSIDSAAGVWEYTARYEVENPQVADAESVDADTESVTLKVEITGNADQFVESMGSLTRTLAEGVDWANDELANIIRDADSRCQAQPMHRMRGVPSVDMVELPNGNQVPACKACVDHYGPLGAL